MSIILNLVGFFIREEDKKYIHIIKISNVKKITYDIIKTYFSSFSIEEEDFKYISLICDAKNIKKEEILLTSLDEEKKIWIFCLKDKIFVVNRNNSNIELELFIQQISSHDYTADIIFLGEYNKWCKQRIENGKINLIDGQDIGTKTIDDKQIIVDDLIKSAKNKSTLFYRTRDTMYFLYNYIHKQCNSKHIFILQ